ncbi:ABC transporter ATP-binding protein [Bianquea renquensis]|uniref:ABC transporter ATP-binding protein n=1 Tax=Bianquea renquensis TaxID=2763661 RepID=A0A926I1L6_9FIRM|nr:ABC transporter ATP-binding protein [Bianquea renquensis]MBC8544384.1 ABC transporter ATP-binding protein [Bianquea renquensis]
MKKTDTQIQRDGRRMLNRLLSYLKPYRRELAFGIFVLAVLAALDTIFPIMLREGIDRFAETGSLEGIWEYVGIYIALIALSTVFVSLGLKSWARSWGYLLNALRRDLFGKLECLSLDYYDTARSGWIIERFMRDVDIIAFFPTKFVHQRGSCVFRLVFFAVVMLALDWRMGLIIMATIPLILLLIKFFSILMIKRQRETRRQGSDMTAFFSETVTGAKNIKCLNLEDRLTEEFHEQSTQVKKVSMSLIRVNSAYAQAIYFMGCLTMGIVVTLGTSLCLDYSMSVGTLAAFISYATALYNNIVSLSAVGERYQNCKAAMERFFSLLDQPVRVDDTPEVKAQYPDEAAIAHLPKLHGGITFENVHFSYEDGQTVFRGLNLTIRPGETIALVGETGAGKTTLVNLACRFYEPTEGRILLDGQDYRNLPLRYIYKNLGYVLQSPHLFSGSILENIRYGRLDATDEEVKAAARMVYADAFISRLAEGYQTDVGEGGSLLSTGERQLVSFARALLVDPSILVLDEATASVDSETEVLISKATEALIEGRTTFIIAHRLSTARGADRILVVDHGAVVEDGTHEELMAARGYYYRLNLRQYENELLA